MPNRYLRESYKESESVSSVSWQAEVLWTRLIVTVDDWGRCEANPKLLRAKLFPLRLDDVREADMPIWLAECEQAGMIRLYTVGGKQYLQMSKWERGRAEKSKYPAPPASDDQPLRTVANNGSQPSTNAPDSDSDPDPDPDNDPDLAHEPPAAAPLARERVRTDVFERFWEAYPRKVGKGAAEKAWKANRCEPLVDKIITAVTRWRENIAWKKDGGQFIPYPATWLNRRSWEDEIPTGIGLSREKLTTFPLSGSGPKGWDPMTDPLPPPPPRGPKGWDASKDPLPGE